MKRETRHLWGREWVPKKKSVGEILKLYLCEENNKKEKEIQGNKPWQCWFLEGRGTESFGHSTISSEPTQAQLETEVLDLTFYTITEWHVACWVMVSLSLEGCDGEMAFRATAALGRSCRSQLECPVYHCCWYGDVLRDPLVHFFFVLMVYMYVCIYIYEIYTYQYFKHIGKKRTSTVNTWFCRCYDLG